MLRSLSAVAARSAITFLVVVHGTVLAGLFAIRLVRRERYRANRCRQNRKQDSCVISHGLVYPRHRHALMKNSEQQWKPKKCSRHGA